MAAEADPTCDDIGYGGTPDADGFLSLDAALMEGATHRAGAVGALKGYMHPIAVARKVMEETPHVFLVGQGARDFATKQGFPETPNDELLTDAARALYAQYKSGQRPAEATGHDTVGCIALDAAGRLVVGCSTSGLDFKLPGRVGDSPIVGSGLYVDDAVGAATCIGMGEQMMQVCMSYRVVMLMERGLTPDEACAEGLRYLLSKRPGIQNLNSLVIALNRDGVTGAAASRAGYEWYVARADVDGGATVRKGAAAV
jgi:Asparaginase